MSSLLNFPPPPEPGSVTLCEVNGELLAGDPDDPQSAMYAQILPCPQVTVSSEMLKPSTTRESAKSAFIEHRETLRQKLVYAWHEAGCSGVLEELASSRSEASPWLSSAARRSLAVIRWCNSLHGSLFPHLALSNEDMIAEFSSNLDWSNGPVRAFAWHPHTAKFALALRDNSIKVYSSSKTDIVPILKHKLQKGVADLAWKPLSASVLAVACQTCVLIWHVDPTSLATRPSTSSVQVLSQSGHGPVTSLAWCPKGGVLISASPADTAMMVWDVATESCVPLRRVGGGGVSFLRWSPDGSKVFAATPSTVFRVWETHTWTCEKWTQMLGRCQCACWSPDGSVLLFATAEAPIIYSLKFHQDVTGCVIDGSMTAVSCVDLSEVVLENEDERFRVGGTAHSMVWDSTGERLAVQFKGEECSEYIAVFRTNIQPVLEIMPCGFIRGDVGDEALIISFMPRFDKGAVLTVVWSSGKVSHIPLYYLSPQAMESNRIPQEKLVNGALDRTTVFTGNVH